MKYFYSAAFLVLFTFGFAQQSFGQFKLSGEVRPRPEFRHGYKTLVGEDAKAAFFTSQRTRINFDYTMESMKFGLSFQDIRTWGGTAQLNETDPYLALHQAWAEVLFTENFSLKLGRQELIYDNHRMFGSVGWAQQARSHDVGLFKYEKDFKLHVGFAFNQDGMGLTGTTYYQPKNYKAMQFAWFNKQYSNFSMSYLFLNNGLQYIDGDNDDNNEVRYSQTIGTFMKGKVSSVSLDGSFYYQFGKDKADNSMGAYQFALNAHFKLNDAWKLTAGMEMLSGTAYDADSDKNNSFSPLYGTNHKFNGFMDYFYVGNHGNNVGLNDFLVGTSWKQGKWRAGATVHYFMSNAKIADDIDSNLGTELDMSLGYKMNSWIDFSAGYSQMFATTSMEALKGGSKDETNNWAYIMITLKPTFLDTSK